MYDGIIFDLDGTLWDSTPEVAVAFNKVLQEKYPEVTDEVTEKKLKGLFGLPLTEIAVKLFQSVPADRAYQVINECCEYENEYLAAVGASLYDGLKETLEELHKSFRLFIVSNCQEGYIECFFKANPDLEHYFDDFEYFGRCGRLKAENIRLIIERNNLKHPVYIGDTKGDAAAAREAGIPFIYARYGFGEVIDYDMAVNSLRELPKVLKYPKQENI